MSNQEIRDRLERLRRLGRLLDEAFTIPVINYRVGIDALVGLIPGIGDVLTLLPSGYLVMEGFKLGVPRTILMLMIFNLALEAVVGLIPIIGDAFDFVWKANTRNLYLLERHLDPAHAPEPPSSRGVVLLVVVIVIVIAALLGIAVYLLRLALSLL